MVWPVKEEWSFARGSSPLNREGKKEKQRGKRGGVIVDFTRTRRLLSVELVRIVN